MSYISSAGLRVFLIMRKSLADGRQFHIRNMNKTVQKIMKMTGFADLFGGDDE
ncbi:MAG: STAS domain-containing protein [Anaerolineaceae bacterium]|nr:STAS domain-containing protein [Anaerolineaceae bacterium]